MAEAKTKNNRYTEAIGRRKTAVARVRIVKSAKAALVVNGRSPENYFPTEELKTIYQKPVDISGGTANYSISAVIKGGGVHAQAQALAMGIARALIKSEPETKPVIKKAKLLSRDERMKERRKFGLKKARKAPQWSKR